MFERAAVPTVGGSGRPGFLHLFGANAALHVQQGLLGEGDTKGTRHAGGVRHPPPALKPGVRFDLT